MKLIFRGHEDRYAVEQSLLAFFPEERPVYEPAEDGEDHALVTLSRSPRYNTAVTTITYHGRTAVASPGPPWTRSWRSMRRSAFARRR